MARKIDLTNQRFGRLVVSGELKKRAKYGHLYWWCKCDCGRKRVRVLSDNLRYGHTRSCGCLKKEQMRTLGRTSIRHGENDKSRLYTAWVNLKRRKKRVRVCKEWLDKKKGYLSFRAWALNHGYILGLHYLNFIVIRIDRRKRYSPDNCRIITRSDLMRRLRGKHNE